MIKNVFYNIQQLLGSDFVLFYLGRDESLTREEKGLYEKKVIGVFYAQGEYLPLKDTKGLEGTGALVLEIPLGKNETGLQTALYAFERLVNNTNGEILYEGQGYNYVFKWQYPTPVGNVDNTYGGRRQLYQLNFSLIISSGLLTANEVSVRIDGENLEGVTTWNENSIIQTQEETNINRFGTRSEALTRTYVLKLQGLVKDISLWERLIQDAYDELDKEYYVEVVFGQDKSKSFLAVLSNITRTGQVGNYQVYELVFVQSATEIFNLIFDANGGEWEDIERYSITYNANGGSGTTTDPNSPYVAGATAVVISNNFTRENYYFTGWDIAQDGSGTNYYPNDEIIMNGNIVLYAQWAELVTIRVTYSGNGGSTSITDPNQYASGATVTVIFNPEPLKSGNKFIGWATSIATEPEYTEDGAKTFEITSAVTLYAVWRPINTITISFDSTKILATASEAVTSEIQIGIFYIKGGQEIGNPITILEDGTTGEFAETGVERLTTAISVPKYDDNYYYNPVISEAVFRTITYNANGGSGTMAPQSVLIGDSAVLRTNIFAKTDEDFIGWANTPSGSVAYDDGATISNITENITLYAIWGYQITFNGNGGQW